MKTYIGYLSLSIVLLLLVFLYNFIHFFWSCSDALTLDIDNPQNTYNAKLFTRNCGATTDFVDYLVVTDGVFHEQLFIGSGLNIKSVTWESEKLLRIGSHKKTNNIVGSKMGVDIVWVLE